MNILPYNTVNKNDSPNFTLKSPVLQNISCGSVLYQS